ncbi:MAG: DNA-processing protein DprA [Desulfarculaceae bacterium]|jgi:DNA processing protein
MEEGKSNPRPDLLDWLGLRLIPGVGSVRFARLLEVFEKPGLALGAPIERLKAIKGVSEAVAQAVHKKAWSTDPARELERLQKMAGRIVTWEDPEYPPLLAQIYAPPPLLYVKGDLSPCRLGGVAVVGSRKTSAYGRREAERLGRNLGRAEESTVSGLALGIDAAAHRGALSVGGHTVGVLGCGLDIPYPRENLELAAEIAGSGALVTEFPLGTSPQAANFPVRNRIISGLSRAVVVIEGGVKSGSLITARHALDQGREVFAMPGPVGTAGVGGCHQLIRQGARLYESPRDVLSPGALPPRMESRNQKPRNTPPNLSAEAQRLIDLLGDKSVHVDVLARESGMPAQSVSAILMQMELMGLIRQEPGMNYVRC